MLRYFTFNGRAGRLEVLFFYALILASAFAADYCQKAPPGSLAFSLLPVTEVFILISLGLWLVALVRRCHDLDLRGGHLLLMLVPVVNVLFLLVLFFKGGFAHSNQTGSIPVSSPGNSQ